jgi:hypothetical protein
MFNPHSDTLPRILALARSNRLKGPTAAFVIQQAEQYARRNRLKFDGSLSNAIRLVEEADRTVRDEFARRQRIHQEAMVEDDRRFFRRVRTIHRG